MTTIDRLVALELDQARATESPFGIDPAHLGALGHALGQVWRDLPPETRRYLIKQARSLLKQLGEDPKGLLWRIVGLAGLLIRRRALPPPKAVRQATLALVRRKRRLKRQRDARPPVTIRKRGSPPRPPMKSRWQRGRRGNRFVDGY